MPPKVGPIRRTALHEFVGVFGVELDVDRVHVGEALEEDGFALHHRLGAQGAKIAEAKDRRAVGDHGDQIALVCVIIGQFWIRRDFFAGNSNAGGIGQRQVALRRHRDRGLNLKLARARVIWKLSASSRVKRCLGIGRPP